MFLLKINELYNNNIINITIAKKHPGNNNIIIK